MAQALDPKSRVQGDAIEALGELSAGSDSAEARKLVALWHDKTAVLLPATQNMLDEAVQKLKFTQRRPPLNEKNLVVTVYGIRDISPGKAYAQTPWHMVVDEARRQNHQLPTERSPEYEITAKGPGIDLRETELNLRDAMMDPSRPEAALLATRVFGLSGLVDDKWLVENLIAAHLDPLNSVQVREAALVSLVNNVSPQSPFAPVVNALYRARFDERQLAKALVLMVSADPALAEGFQAARLAHGRTSDVPKGSEKANEGPLKAKAAVELKTDIQKLDALVHAFESSYGGETPQSLKFLAASTSLEAVQSLLAIARDPSATSHADALEVLKLLLAKANLNDQRYLAAKGETDPGQMVKKLLLIALDPMDPHYREAVAQLKTQLPWDSVYQKALLRLEARRDRSAAGLDAFRASCSTILSRKPLSWVEYLARLPINR